MNILRIPQRFKPPQSPQTYTLSDIKRGEYARDIHRHEESLAVRQKQIEGLIADQKDEVLVLASIRAAEACLNGPIIDAKVEALLAEGISFDPDPTGATDALIAAEMANGRMPPELTVVERKEAAAE